jgi:hypothetical protein
LQPSPASWKWQASSRERKKNSIRRKIWHRPSPREGPEESGRGKTPVLKFQSKTAACWDGRSASSRCGGARNGSPTVQPRSPPATLRSCRA